MVRFVFRSVDFPHNRLWELTPEQQLEIVKAISENIMPKGVPIQNFYQDIAEECFGTKLWFRVGQMVMHSKEVELTLDENGDVVGLWQR